MRIRCHNDVQVFAEDIQVGLAGVEVLDDNDLGFQVCYFFQQFQGLLMS